MKPDSFIYKFTKAVDESGLSWKEVKDLLGLGELSYTEWCNGNAGQPPAYWQSRYIEYINSTITKGS